MSGTDPTGTADTTDAARVAELRRAEDVARELFDTAVARGLLRPGVSERALSDEIRDLAHAEFGIERFWHKRVVRSGPNTLHPYRENPPDRVLADDDIVFLDFGPLLTAWEADLGRTYVLGDDPRKHRIAEALPVMFERGRAVFEADPDITGAGLYAAVVAAAEAEGWRFGGVHAGHLIGEFPHERLAPDRETAYIAPVNTTPMRAPDPDGRPRHWILEIHLIDPELGVGGFYEQLLV